MRATLQHSEVRFDRLAGEDRALSQLRVAEIFGEAFLDPQRRARAAVLDQVVNELVKRCAICSAAEAGLHDHRAAIGL